MSDFIVRKGLLIEKVPAQENGDLSGFSHPSLESLEFRLVLCQGRENGRDKR